MKKALLFILCLLAGISGNLHAQSSLPDSKGAIGITYSGSWDNQAYYFQSLVGAGGYDGKGYHSFGITYVRPLSGTIDIETGISYRKYKYQFSNASLGPEAPEPYKVTNTVVDISVGLFVNPYYKMHSLLSF